MANNVYSPPDLGPGHNQAAGDDSDPRGERTAAGDPSDPREDGLSRSGLRNAEAGSAQNSAGDNQDSLDSEGLDDAEAAAAESFASGFEEDEQIPRMQQARNFARRNRRPLLIVGAVGGGGLLSLIIAMFTLIPLKVETMMQNMESRFFSSVNSAVGEATKDIFSEYIVKHVIPDYTSGHCSTTIDRHCKVTIYANGNNPVTNLYHGWAKAKFEKKLYTKYNIEFKFYPKTKTWHVINHNISGPNGDEDIGTHGEMLKYRMTRTERKAVLNSLADDIGIESKSERVMFRYKVGRLADRTSGTKRCLFYCGLRELRELPRRTTEKAARYILAERVLAPRRELTAIAAKCILSPDCNPQHVEPDPNDPKAPELSAYEAEQQAKLESMAAEMGLKDFTELKAIHKELSDKGFQKYLVEQTLQKVMSKEASQKVSDSIPILGWINLAAQVVNAASDAGPKIKKITFVVGAASAVEAYQTYRSWPDEQHTGHVDPGIAGSMSDSLGPGVADPNDPLVGGTASAEEAPLYNNINGEGPQKKSPNYQCNDGKVPDVNTTCSEERLGRNNGVESAVHDFLNTSCLTNPSTVGAGVGLQLVGSSCADGIIALAHVWRGTVGQVFNLLDNIANGVLAPVFKGLQTAADGACSASHVLPFGGALLFAGSPVTGAYCAVKGTIDDVAPKVANAFTNWVIPNALGSNMGGGRLYTVLASGANVLANQSCEQMGCQAVNDTTASALIKQQRTEARAEFARQPFFARMFSTDNSYSLVSKMAMATPLSLHSSTQTEVASLLSNPLSAFTSSFGSIFGGRALAADTTNPDPFNIGNQAYPSNKMPKDFEKNWDSAGCGDDSENGNVAQWQKAAADGPVSDKTGMPVHTDVNSCLLTTYVTGVVGATTDSNLLTADDKSEIPGSSSTTDSTTSTADATIDKAKLFDDSSSVACADNTKDIGVEDGYTDGKKVRIRLCRISNLPSTGSEASGGYGISGGNGKCILNSRVSGAVYEMVDAAKKDGVSLVADSCFRTMDHQQALWVQYGMDTNKVAKPGYSNHQMGIAMDFKTLPGTPGPVRGNKVWDWLAKNASDFGYKNYPQEAWHWSPTGN